MFELQKPYRIGSLNRATIIINKALQTQQLLEIILKYQVEPKTTFHKDILCREGKGVADSPCPHLPLLLIHFVKVSSAIT